MAKRKSRLEILRGKVQRALGPGHTVRDDMPEEIAESFIAEMRFCCDDCGARAATHWTPGQRGGFDPSKLSTPAKDGLVN